MKIKLTNDFHGTQAWISEKALVNAVDTFYSSEGKKITGAARRVWSELCGIEECACGNFLGMRGPQENKKELPIEVW